MDELCVVPSSGNVFKDLELPNADQLLEEAELALALHLLNYGIVAVADDGEILHFSGYEHEPQKVDFDSLESELRTDPEFGITCDAWVLRIATDEEVQHVREAMIPSSD